jgi:hypothetical protein
VTPAHARTILLLFFLSLLSVAFLPSLVYADELVVSTNKSSYSLGATINVYGTLTLTGVPVTDGLVAVQVDDSLENLRLIRVVPTGTLPSPWKVRIVEFLSCDSEGNPKSSFNRGSLAFFKVTVESLDTALVRQVTVAFNLLDWVGVSIAITYTRFPLAPGAQFTFGPTSLPIPDDAFVGTGMCCVSVLTDWPKDGGQPYCPENSVEIEITGGTSEATGSPPESPTSLPGSYNLSFKLPSNAMLGDYTVFASARYNAWATTRFDYFWRYTDVNRDGNVDILDIAIAAKAYGSYHGHPRWNPKADLDGNNKVDIVDIATVAKDYGKKRT